MRTSQQYLEYVREKAVDRLKQRLLDKDRRSYRRALRRDKFDLAREVELLAEQMNKVNALVIRKAD